MTPSLSAFSRWFFRNTLPLAFLGISLKLRTPRRTEATVEAQVRVRGRSVVRPFDLDLEFLFVTVTLVLKLDCDRGA